MAVSWGPHLGALYLMTKFNVARQLWISWKSGFWDRRNGGEPHKSLKFVDFVESAPFPEAISKAPVYFLDFRPPPKAGVPRFCPGDSSTNPELVREEPPKVTVSRVVRGAVEVHVAV